MEDSVRLADVRKELVSQALAAGGAPDQAGDIDDIDRRRNRPLRLAYLAEHVEALVRNRRRAEVRLYRAEGEIGALRPRRADAVKQSGLPHIRKSNYAAFQGHILIKSCPVVLYVGVIHHHGDDHLGLVTRDLLPGLDGVVLGVVRLGLAAGHLEHVGAEIAGDGAGDFAFLRSGDRTDELGIVLAGTEGREGDAALRAHARPEGLGNRLEVGLAGNLLGDLGNVLLGVLISIQPVLDRLGDLSHGGYALLVGGLEGDHEEAVVADGDDAGDWPIFASSNLSMPFAKM